MTAYINSTTHICREQHHTLDSAFVLGRTRHSVISFSDTRCNTATHTIELLADGVICNTSVIIITVNIMPILSGLKNIGSQCCTLLILMNRNMAPFCTVFVLGTGSE